MKSNGYDDNDELRQEAERERARYQQSRRTDGFDPTWQNPQIDYANEPDARPRAREWLVPEWIPMRETTGLSGPGGVGKTLLAHMLATAATLGLTRGPQMWLGMPVTPMRACLVLNEDDADDALWRQRYINDRYQCENRDLARSLLTMPRRDCEENRLAIFDRDGTHDPTPWFALLRQEIEQSEAQLVILGGLMDCFHGNQNAPFQARQFVRKICDALARRSTKGAARNGCTLLLYQPSLTGLRERTGSFGATQWDAAFRSRLYLTRPESEEGEDPPDPNARVLSRLKANYASQDDSLDLLWQDWTFVREEDADIDQPQYERQTQANQRAQTTITIFWQQWDLATERGITFSPLDGSRYFPPRFIAREIRGTPSAKGISEIALNRLYKTLVRSGELYIDTSGRDPRLARRI